MARSFSKKDLDFESGRGVSNAETPVGVLQDIAKKCGTEVLEYFYSTKFLAQCIDLKKKEKKKKLSLEFSVSVHLM